MKFAAFALFLALAVVAAKNVFWSFRAQRPTDYTSTGPDFALRDVLSGPIASEGLIYGPRGRMTNSFVAQMYGEWDGDTGTLTEDFTYSNGKTQQRKWFLTMGPDNTFTATADDIVGEGRGTISGSTVMLRYRLVLPEDAGGHRLDVVDWMYLMQDGSIMNRSEMRKFGIKVAELVATMRPDPDAEQPAVAAE